MCGNSRSSDYKSPTTEVYLDKFVKYIFSPILFILGIIGLIMLFLVDKINCYDYPSAGTSTGRSQAEEFCWIDFSEAVNSTNTWVQVNRLPHKLFPIFIIGESACVLLPIILWYWCYGRGVGDDVSAIVDHVNSLMDAYSHYDRGRHLTVSEHLLNHLDNYLQFFIYCLTSRARSTFVSFILKWICMIFILCAWVVGFLLIHMNFDFEIFRDKFICLYNTDRNGVQSAAICTIPTSTYLRAVWFINMAVAIALIFATIAYVIDSCRPKLYEKSFFYNSIPGCMDRRLAMCVKKFFSSQHVSLLAKFCEMNSHLLYDVGRSKTLARKYALLEGISPGRESIVDRHYPVIQPHQLDEFVLQSELHFLNIQSKSTAKSTQKTDVKDERNAKSVPKLKLFGKRKRKVKPKPSHQKTQLRYMPPHILKRTVRKFGADSPSFRDLNESPITQRSNQTQLTLEDLDFKTSTPERVNLSNRSFFLPMDSSRAQTRQSSHVYPINVVRPIQSSRNRELDPYAYRLYTSILRKKAENVGRWKP